MFTNFFVNVLVSFILALLITWIVLSVILLWFQPAFYNEDSSLNWLTTFWVAAVIIVFTWILLIILYFLFEFIWDRCNTSCEEKLMECEKPCERIHEKPCHKDECGFNINPLNTMNPMRKGAYKF